MACGKELFESGSPCLDVPVTSTRQQQREQSIAWVAVVLNDVPCFPQASCVVDALQGWEMAADDALCHLHQPLEALQSAVEQLLNQELMQPAKMPRWQ